MRNVLLAVFLLLLASFVLLDFRFRQFLGHEFDRELLAKAMVLATLIIEKRDRVELEFDDALMPEFEAEERPEYFQIWLESGRVLERSRSLRGNELPRDPIQTMTPEFKTIDLGGHQLRLVQRLVIPQLADDDSTEENSAEDIDENWAEDIEESAAEDRISANRPPVHLSVARGFETLEQLIVQMRVILASTGISAFVILALVLRVSITRGLVPLQSMSEQVRAIRPDQLDDAKPLATFTQELHPIALQMNTLLRRMSESMIREKRFSGDVAHELRTPVAELRSIAEIGRKWLADPAVSKEFFDTAQEITQDMEHTIANLLALARCENGPVDVVAETFDVREIVTEVCQRYEKKALDRRVRFEIDDKSIWIQSDRYKLGLILNNLISNAIEYTASDEAVRISFTENGAVPSIAVANKTIGLTEEDLPHLFDRLWRKDASRHGSTHAGVGLALVKALADVLNIDVTPDLAGAQTFVMCLRGFRRAPEHPKRCIA